MSAQKRGPQGAIAIVLAGAAAALAVSGCDSEPDVWDTFVGSPVRAVGLSGSVALIDPAAERVLMLAVEEDLTLAPASIYIGEEMCIRDRMSAMRRMCAPSTPRAFTAAVVRSITSFIALSLIHI